MNDLMDLAGKSVIVTGASSGIGASTARSEELDGALAVADQIGIATGAAQSSANVTWGSQVPLGQPLRVRDPLWA